ncbi:radical SAM protein [bacterium]|nr:radical SAM protein [bacterium]
MPNILAGSVNGKFGVKPIKSLHVLSLVVNDTCNLGCRHCYFQSEQDSNALTTEEWLRFLDSAIRRLEPVVMTFAGREIFAEPQSADLFFETIHLLRQLKPKRRTDIGVITNGTLLAAYQDRLTAMPPDYLDVSIDGLPAQHDAVRGSGAFERMDPQLRWLRDHMQNVWLTPTLNGTTIFRLAEIISYYRQEYGFRRFSVGFYVPMVHTDLDLAISKEAFQSFAEKTLPALERVKGLSDCEIIFELDQNQKHLIHSLEVTGYLKVGRPLTSEDFLLDNGLTLTFNIARIPVGLWRSVRVSRSGGWVAAEDMLRVNEYSRLATAWVRECGYDADKLYQAGLASARFQELLDASPDLQAYYSKSKKSPSQGRRQQALV